MVLSPVVSWLFVGMVAAFIVFAVIALVELERRSSRRFWSADAKYDDPDFIARRRALHERMARNPHIYYDASRENNDEH